MKRSPLARKTALRKQSAKQAKKQRTWSALKLARIRFQIKRRGHVYCNRCSKQFWGVDAARYGLHAHHVVQRSLGGEYTDENMRLLCADCHRSVHEAGGEALRR